MTVTVYVALGTRRVGAAVEHTGNLVASGARVTLLIADRPEWAEAAFAPAVTVHRLSPGSPRAARRFLLADGSPLRDGDVLIAGDPEALATAWSVGRRRPGVSVRLEPSPEPGRRTAAADLAVVTPWYPSPDDPYAGAFVQASTAAVGPDHDRIAILHTQNWYYSPAGVAGNLVGVAAERQAARSGHAVVLDTAEGELTRVAVPTAAGRGYPAFAEAQVRALRAVLPTGRIEAPVVHAHTGMLGGVVAAALAHPEARIVVTEHATFLPKVFEQPGARRQYGEMLARADVLLCVGGYLHDQLSGYFPEHAHKLRIVPNAIDFDRFTMRPRRPTELSRWLYVGRLMAHKGVLTLVDGFARIAAEDPRVTLTLVGSGPLEETLDRRIADLGLGERITRRPAVPPAGVTALMHDHDLLVHASNLETFGMTVVEAVATGTPVLVARSQGPRETLAGAEQHAGLLIETGDDPDVIADGYRLLRSRLDTLDLPRARAMLAARYGAEAVAAQLRQVYAPVPGPTAVPSAGPTAVPSAGPTAVASAVAGEPECGWTARRGPGDGLTVHELGTAGSRQWLLRLGRLVVTVPDRILSGAQRAAATLPAPGPEALVRYLRRIPEAVHERVFLQGYEVVRPYILRRVARRAVLPGRRPSREDDRVVQ